jgi:hypothetical protein
MDEFKTLTMANYSVAVEKLLERSTKDDEMFVNDLKYLLNSMKQSKDREKLSRYIIYENSDKILHILSLVKDLGLAQLFIGDIMFQFDKDNCKGFADLIKIFGYDKLNESIKSLVLPMDSTGFPSTCELIKVNFFITFMKLMLFFI